jgi:hypothetical protein
MYGITSSPAVCAPDPEWLLIVHSKGENHEAYQTNRWGSYCGIAL